MTSSHIESKRTRGNNVVVSNTGGLLPDSFWRPHLQNRETELVEQLRAWIDKTFSPLREKFNPAGKYFGYACRGCSDRVYIYVQKKNLVVDLAISREHEPDIRRAGFEVDYRDNFQGRIGWLTGWKIPVTHRRTGDVEPWIGKALTE